MDAQLRLIVDEALDATCERHGQDPYAPAILANPKINGRPANDEELVRWDDSIIGVRLGDLAAGACIDIETDYILPSVFSNVADPSLRVEVFRTEPQAAPSGELAEPRDGK